MQCSICGMNMPIEDGICRSCTRVIDEIKMVLNGGCDYEIKTKFKNGRLTNVHVPMDLIKAYNPQNPVTW